MDAADSARIRRAPARTGRGCDGGRGLRRRPRPRRDAASRLSSSQQRVEPARLSRVPGRDSDAPSKQGRCGPTWTGRSPALTSRSSCPASVAWGEARWTPVRSRRRGDRSMTEPAVGGDGAPSAGSPAATGPTSAASIVAAAERLATEITRNARPKLTRSGRARAASPTRPAPRSRSVCGVCRCSPTGCSSGWGRCGRSWMQLGGSLAGAGARCGGSRARRSRVRAARRCCRSPEPGGCAAGAPCRSPGAPPRRSRPAAGVDDAGARLIALEPGAVGHAAGRGGPATARPGPGSRAAGRRGVRQRRSLTPGPLAPFAPGTFRRPGEAKSSQLRDEAAFAVNLSPGAGG